MRSQKYKMEEKGIESNHKRRLIVKMNLREKIKAICILFTEQTGLTFGQLCKSDTTDGKKELKHLFEMDRLKLDSAKIAPFSQSGRKMCMMASLISKVTQL